MRVGEGIRIVSLALCGLAAAVYLGQLGYTAYQSRMLHDEAKIKAASQMIQQVQAKAAAKLGVDLATYVAEGAPDTRDQACVDKYVARFVYFNSSKASCCIDGRAGRECLEL